MALFRGMGARKDATRGTSPIEVRKSLAGLFSTTGVMPGGPSPLLTGTAGWAYTVAGPAWFVASRGPSDGVMLYGNDGPVVIGTTGVGSTVPIAPGAGLSRIDIAWTRHPTMGENADTSSEPLFGVESGVAAASNPVAPTIPAGALELGRNLMTSAATSTLSAGNTITQSALYTALRGAPIPVRNQAERDALPLFDGQRADRLDLHLVERYDGTTWTGGAWISSTGFVVSTTGVAMTNYSAVLRYTMANKAVQMSFAFTPLAGFTPGTGEIIIPLPVNAVAGSGLVGDFTFYDASTGFKVRGYVQLANTVQAVCRYVVTQNGAESSMSPNVTPVVWAVNDNLMARVVYEAA